MKENSIEEDMKILKEIIKGDEDCINAIYSQMKVKNDNDEDIQYFKKEIQSIKNIVNNYLKEKARADKIYGNDKLNPVIVAIGAGIGADFDITKIRYGKVIIMADADVDGAHIRKL